MTVVNRPDGTIIISEKVRYETGNIFRAMFAYQGYSERKAIALFRRHLRLEKMEVVQ